jgi:hypothetical protein
VLRHEIDFSALGITACRQPARPKFSFRISLAGGSGFGICLAALPSLGHFADCSDRSRRPVGIASAFLVAFQSGTGAIGGQVMNASEHSAKWDFP